MSQGPLADRVAIVTCGGFAAGRGYARALAAAGARVVVADPFPDAGEETVALIEEAGGAARYVGVDLLDEVSLGAVVAQAVDAFGRLDVLVNNPNRYGDTSFTALADLTVDHWDTTMAVMVRGVMLMCRAAVPVLATSPHPTIVNHTSSAAYGVRNWLDYGTARGAVIAMTKSLAKGFAPLGIRVNALSVGSSGAEAVALGVVRDDEQMMSTPEFKAQLIPRLATEDDVAGPIVFLAGEASSYMTGQTISYDGGKFFLGMTMELTPLEIMERLSATWFPDAMADPGTAQAWEQLFADDIVLVEPASLPHGGRHEGLAAFEAVQAGMRALWDQRIEAADYWLCGEERVTLRIVIRWTAHATGRSVVLPMIDLLRVADGRIVEIEVFLHDTAALLATLD